MHHDDNQLNECFRRYASPEESWVDHSDFLTSRPRYAHLFRLGKNDYKAWAKGLQEAGYATNIHYARRLVTIIEEEGLHRLDEGDKGKHARTRERKEKTGYQLANYRERVVRVNGVPCVQTREGDTFEAIAVYFNIPLWKLLDINDKREPSIRPGLNVYLKAKKNKAAKAHTRHRVKTGETAYWIAQVYGIKLNRLLDYNYLRVNEPLRPGETLFLRGYNTMR
jgi:LysM repeat protein